MDRKDSAFDEASRLKDVQPSPAFIHRSNTAPTQPRKANRITSDPSPNQNLVSRGARCSASENTATAHNKQTRSCRKSASSSTDDSTKSQRRGHGSVPSSGRTSCTIVDPSRPTRHYRIKSSQTCPTTSRDLDDVLALHFRSCSLFQNPTYHQSAIPSPVDSAYHGADTDFAPMPTRPDPAPQASNDNTKSSAPKAFDQPVVSHEELNTTMYWTSTGTRRGQYEEMDKANSGFRALLRKIMPRCVSGPPLPTFYEDNKPDAGSVRRFRMDLPDAEEYDEKSALRLQRHQLERTTTDKTEVKSKRWGCF